MPLFLRTLTMLVLGGFLMTDGLAQVTEDLPIEVDAEELEYKANEKVLIGRGNVVVRQGDDVLTADRARVYRESGIVEAEGNVHLERAGKVWDGPELVYNFKTREADTGEFLAFSDPFIIRAEESERGRDKVIKLRNASITTCEGDNPEFWLRSKDATVDEENVLRAKNVVFFLGPVPFFYFPYVVRDLDAKTNIDVVPGYSSEMGAFLLTAYNYKLHPQVRGTTRLDYRSDRGLGVGQDFYWYDFEKTYEGRLYTYYTNDDEPYEDGEEELARGDEVDSDRYRVRLQHSQALTDTSYVLAEINYLSDADVIEDFFDREFRQMPIPENRVSLTQRGDWYTLNLLVNKQLNEDDFENIDRIPEVSFDVNRSEIGDSGLYYEGAHEAVNLSQTLPDSRADEEERDTFRLDTDNTIYWPTRHGGFLNTIPRIGYRGTSYSTTRDSFQVTTTETTTNEAGVVSTGDVLETIEEEGGAELRSILELGLESSYKAFKVLHEDPLWGDYRGLRHIVEPFIDYTYSPEPNVLPGDLFQFDATDRLNERNDIEIGMRHKLQTKKGLKIVDLLDTTFSTRYFLDPIDDADDFGPLLLDAELRLAEYMPIDIDLIYNFEQSIMEEFNTQIGFEARDYSNIYLEYRFRDEEAILNPTGTPRNQVTLSMDLFPNAPWSLETYLRYNFEESTLEEHDYLLKRKLQCIGVGLGVREIIREERDDDLLVYGVLWLQALPDSLVQLGR